MKIIMVDQDGVVCDTNYCLTANIADIVSDLDKTGQFIIVPNSDTPAERLRSNFRKMISLEPKILIAERGAVVEIEGTKKHISNIAGIKEFVLEVEKSFRELDYCVEVGDAATWVRENKKFQPNSLVVLIDGLREQTIAMFFKKSDQIGSLLNDQAFALNCLAVMNGLSLPSGLLQPDYNEKYGIVICNAAFVNKTSGYLFIRERYPLAQFYMIGDGDSDIIFDEQVIHCAVANASPLFKKNASFVSDYPITEGLADCLKWISS